METELFSISYSIASIEQQTHINMIHISAPHDKKIYSLVSIRGSDAGKGLQSDVDAAWLT